MDEEKVKKLSKSIFLESDSLSPQSKKLKLSRDEVSNNITIDPISVNYGNWIEVFCPKSCKDLAVQPKKISEVREWLLSCKKNHQNGLYAKILLLTGPSGCGKTSTINLVSKELNYETVEWINPVDYENNETSDNSQSTSFKDFLFRASRYKSLLSNSDKRLLLIEDIPNFLLRDNSAFEVILQDYLQYGKAPLVFIAADSKARNLNIRYNLFPDPIKIKYGITHILFNSVATTLMQNAMKRFCSIMRNAAYKVPEPNLLESIILSADGDIRNALINLHFASLKGVPELERITTFRKLSSRTKETKKVQKTFKSIGCDNSITMMHALGRVFNPKFMNDKLVHCPETISECFALDAKKFLELVHANYLVHFENIESSKDAANDISIADLLLRYEFHTNIMGHIALNIGVRGVMVPNDRPVSGWMPVRSSKISSYLLEPSVIARDKAVEEFMIPRNVSLNIFTSEYSSYLKRISQHKSK